MSRTTRFSGAFAVAAIAWVVCLAPSAAGAAEAPSSACAQAVPPDDAGATTEAKLSLDTEETGADHLEFKFGRERRPQDDAFIFKSDGVLPPRNTTLITSISSLRNSDGRRLRGVEASAVVISRHAVKVTVCIEPDGAPPGKYNGSVGFSDDRITSTSGRVVANVQYAHAPLLLFFAIAACLGAILFAWLSSSQVTLAWFRSPSTIVAIAAAFIATVGVYFNQYIKNPAWNFDGEFLGFMGAAYAGAIAALTTLRAGGSVVARVANRNDPDPPNDEPK